MNAFIMSLVPELGALGSNEGGARATGSSTLSPNIGSADISLTAP